MTEPAAKSEPLSPSPQGDTPKFDAEFQGRLEDLIHWRRDVRRFRAKAVDDALIDALIGLAARAPSVGNSQPWRFVKVADPGRRAAVIENFEACNADALA
ncbi:MAG: nitroreductase family protein, partial [Rhodospirillales bacterium]|nr:nitroreductase family protein [Rhodospirillales bacterium]